MLSIKEVKIKDKLVEKNQPAVKRWRNSLQEFVENNPESRAPDYRASTYEQMTSLFGPRSQMEKDGVPTLGWYWFSVPGGGEWSRRLAD